MKRVHKFNTVNEFNTYVDNDYEEPFVCNKVGNGVETTYHNTTYNLKYIAKPLTFEIVSGGTLY